MNLIAEFGDLHDAKCVTILRNSNLARPRPDRWKGLPVVGLLSALNLVELIPGVAPRFVREGPQIVQGGIYEIDILRLVSAVIHTYHI